MERDEISQELFYPHRASDDGESWLLARSLPKRVAKLQSDSLIADSEARVDRLLAFATKFGVSSVAGASDLDRLNDLYHELVESDQVVAQVLRAIAWDVALLIGSLAIAEHPQVLQWKFQGTGPTFDSFQTPVLAGHLGVRVPRGYSVPIFLTIERHAWAWIGQRTGHAQKDPERKVHLFRTVYESAVAGAEAPEDGAAFTSL
jgi:hypothetical protein